jgi:hypothetical protein
MSVLASPYRKELLPLMEQRLVAPDQAISEVYLDTLVQLRETVASSPDRSPSPDYVTRLGWHSPGKKPVARAESAHTLLNIALRDGRSQPAWLPLVLRSLIADFRSLPIFAQTMLLEIRWTVLESPAMLPVLRDLVDPRIRSIALRRLYEMSPEEGRKIILAEIAKPEGSDIPFSTLAMLPDASLPDMDEVLAAKFDPLLIVRYATGSVVERIKGKFERTTADLRRQDVPSCLGPIAFYFLKHDPPYGERLLREQFEAETAAPYCYDIGAQFQPARQMGVHSRARTPCHPITHQRKSAR